MDDEVEEPDDDDFDDYDRDFDEGYAPKGSIDFSRLATALCELPLLGDDLFMRMQANNLAMVDGFITNLEYEVLQEWFHEERTPMPGTFFLSAQTQMWLFALYELLRTWRQRASNMVKWSENGDGLQLKLAALEKDVGYNHVGRSVQADQIRSVIEDPASILEIKKALRRTSIVMLQLEVLRVSLAKHELWKRQNSPAHFPGYGRINRWCGSLDYELENGSGVLGYINRRTFADVIRKLPPDDELPTDEEIKQFEKIFRGTASTNTD